MHANITRSAAGDGIGPEVVAEGVKVLQAVAEQVRPHLQVHRLPDRRHRHRRDGQPRCPTRRWPQCQASDAVLLGAVGGPKWSDPRAPVRPEQGLLGDPRPGWGCSPTCGRSRSTPRWSTHPRSSPRSWRGWIMVILRELTGGALLRQAAGPVRRDARTARAVDTHVLHRGRDQPADARGVRAGARPAQEGHLGGQGQRAGLLAPLAHGGPRGRRRVSRRGDGGRAGGCVRDVPDAPSAPTST